MLELRFDGVPVSKARRGATGYGEDIHRQHLASLKTGERGRGFLL